MNDHHLKKNIVSEMNSQSDYFINNNEYQEDVNQSKFSSIRVKNKTEIWSEWSKSIVSDINTNNNILENFRKKNYFITDVPGEMTKFKKFIYKTLTFLPNKLKKLDPKICMLEDLYDFLITENLKRLLSENPSPKTGNPELYKKEDMFFTQRWIRHIWLLSLYNKFLKNKKIKTILDIGSNYGALPYLLKKNDKNLKFILIDFPEALSTAKYFLKKELPNVKIASFDDLKNIKIIDQKIIDKYDFILVPCFWINKIEKNLIDLTINVASFNEMNRYWFNKYTKSFAYKTCKYIFLFNRFSRPAVEKNEQPIDILDLELNNYKKIYFNVSQLYKWDYTKRNYFFGIPFSFEKKIQQPVYEYIGEKLSNLNI
ncbi:putative sugar O-methyltransferase [Pelagibacteraceae bacterium]|nr:putative sugar O-methyltransferase [Pelagibacteraceae bacterium]